MRLEGVFVANVSLFTEQGALDQVAMEAHLNFLASHGVHGFVPCGTTSESPTLSEREWSSSITLAKKVADTKGLKVIAGCGGNATEKVAALIDQATGLGADAALVVCPYYNKPTYNGLMAHFKFLADRSSIPLILYNIPGRTNVNLGAQGITELLKHENIVGVKESSGDFGLWMQVAAQNDLTKSSLLAGDDHALATILDLGGSGIISGSANVAPEFFVQIYQAHKRGDKQTAHDIQKRIQPLVTALFLETNPAPVKYALSLRLKTNPALRLPLVETTASTQKAVSESLRALEIGT